MGVGGHRLKIKLFGVSFICILGYFLAVKVHNMGLFYWRGGGGAAKISNIFGVCLIFLVDFGST